MRIGLPTASRARVRGMRHARAAVDNPQPAGIAPIGPLNTVLTSGATSVTHNVEYARSGTLYWNWGDCARLDAARI